ncbi:MAG: hypothetical protein QM727_06690 [Niabella sp.]
MRYNNLLPVFLTALLVFPPSISNNTDNKEWGKREVDYAGVHAAGGTVTKLLGRFGAYRALRRNGQRCYDQKNA